MSGADGDSREYYLKIFEDFPALIWRSGLDMKCDYFNRTWLAFTGRTLEQEQGDGWAEGVHPDDLSACFTTYVENFRERRPFSMFYRLRNRFGEYRWIKDIGRPFYGLEGEFKGYIGSCYDVTDEREKEKRLEELNRVKDTFFSIVAHDLVGPVGAIESLTGMLSGDYQSLGETVVGETMRELNAAAIEVERLLDDLLTWSRSQMQGLSCSPEPLELFPLVDRAVDPLRESIRLKTLSLDNRVDPSIWGFADANMLKTIVRNLVSNALKFSPRGTSIEVSSGVRDGFILLRVTDHGIGISAGNLENLFVPGNRNSRVGTGGERGTGLGLAICREFAERNGGKIWAESREGEGSSFTVMLPAASR